VARPRRRARPRPDARQTLSRPPGSAMRGRISGCASAG
jgi:hypothetical protein